MNRLRSGEAGKLRTALKNGGAITMPAMDAPSMKRRTQHNERLEKQGYLIEVRGVWYVTPAGEEAVREYRRQLNIARNLRKATRRAAR